MHNYKNKTYKQEKGEEKKEEKQNTLGELRADETFRGKGWGAEKNLVT